jgi:hypothetical protein
MNTTFSWMVRFAVHALFACVAQLEDFGSPLTLNKELQGLAQLCSSH